MDKNIIDALPAWATLSVECGGQREVIECDPHACYPAYLDELHALDNTITATVYGAELARRCATLDLKALCGPGINVRWVSKRVRDEQGNPTLQKTGDAWKLSNLPVTIPKDAAGKSIYKDADGNPREPNETEIAALRATEEAQGINKAPAIYKRLVAARTAKAH